MRLTIETETRHKSASSFFREQVRALSSMGKGAFIEFSHREAQNVRRAAHSLCDGTKIKQKTVDYENGKSVLRFYIETKGSGKKLPAFRRK